MTEHNCNEYMEFMKSDCKWYCSYCGTVRSTDKKNKDEDSNNKK